MDCFKSFIPSSAEDQQDTISAVAAAALRFTKAMTRRPLVTTKSKDSPAISEIFPSSRCKWCNHDLSDICKITWATERILLNASTMVDYFALLSLPHSITFQISDEHWIKWYCDRVSQGSHSVRTAHDSGGTPRWWRTLLQLALSKICPCSARRANVQEILYLRFVLVHRHKCLPYFLQSAVGRIACRGPIFSGERTSEEPSLELHLVSNGTDVSYPGKA